MAETASSRQAGVKPLRRNRSRVAVGVQGVLGENDAARWAGHGAQGQAHREDAVPADGHDQAADAGRRVESREAAFYVVFVFVIFLLTVVLDT